MQRRCVGMMCPGLILVNKEEGYSLQDAIQHSKLDLQDLRLAVRFARTLATPR